MNIWRQKIETDFKIKTTTDESYQVTIFLPIKPFDNR